MTFRTISRRLTAIALATAAATTMTVGAVHAAPASAANPDVQGAINSNDPSTPGTPDVPGGGFPKGTKICSGSACGLSASEWHQHCRAFPNAAGCKVPKPKPIDM